MSSIDPEFEGNGNDSFEDMEISVPEQKSQGEYCADGPVILRLVQIEKGVAQSGSPKLVMKFEFASNAKKSYTKHFSLNDNALWVLSQFVCAIDPEQNAAFLKSKGAFKAKIKKEFIGQLVIGQNKNQKKDGDKVFMDIVKWLPLDKAAKEEIDGDVPY
jgi:hypothetical protein